MPLPWLIGAAVVAAAAVVVKAVSDDDSKPSSDSGDAERRKQEREARHKRERDGLSTQLGNLKLERLEEAHRLLALSAETLSQLPQKVMELSTPELEAALMAEQQANSDYAQGMSAILSIPDHSRKCLPRKEQDEFLVNLQMLESLYGPIPFDSEGERDLTALRQTEMQLNRLMQLKQQIEEQG